MTEEDCIPEGWEKVEARKFGKIWLANKFIKNFCNNCRKEGNCQKNNAIKTCIKAGTSIWMGEGFVKVTKKDRIMMEKVICKKFKQEKKT